MNFQIFTLISLILYISRTYDWTPVKQVVDLYYKNSAYPGAVLRVANKTHTLYTYQNGYLSQKSHVPFTQQTVFDIASLTKVSATLSSVMRLYDQKRFQLNDLLIKYIPEYDNNNKSSTTIKNLLLHNAGLAPDHPDPAHTSKQQILKWTYNCKLTYTIGTKMVYSDLSFILLGILVERLSGQPLQKYAKDVFLSMGIHNSTYLPYSNEVYNIAPTEFSSFRKKLIHGEVHDPTAYSFKGVAGHAGFFSTASDLQKYMQVHINNGKLPNGSHVYLAETVSTFYTRQDGLPYNNRRALGWDTIPIQDNPPCGHLFSMNSFGHTGYTGTMMWADRDKGLVVVLLTNRVHPTSQSYLMPEARSNIVDAIVKIYMNMTMN